MPCPWMKVLSLPSPAPPPSPISHLQWLLNVFLEICSQFAYTSVCLLSFRLHVSFHLQMCIISPIYGYDLGGLSRDKTDFALLWLTTQSPKEDCWEATSQSVQTDMYLPARRGQDSHDYPAACYRRTEPPSQEEVCGDRQKDWDDNADVWRLHN